MAAGTGLVWAEAYRDHDPGPGHPESPARITAVREGLERSGLIERCVRLTPRPASEEELQRCHSLAYIHSVIRDVADGKPCLSTGDTGLGARSEEVARLAAGGAIVAVEAVLTGVVRNAFAVVRPPGHHAEASRGVGFCIYNNVAVAARHAQAMYGLERVLIVDWDVHHGNGTEAIFRQDPSVLYFSIHQSPLYPGTGAADDCGEGAGEGTTINCPLLAGSDGEAVIGALRARLLPAAERFRPQLVLVSAGFDGRRGDPLADFQLSDADFSCLTQEVMALADRHSQGRLVSCLEGGYTLAGLASACTAHVAALLRPFRGVLAPVACPYPGVRVGSVGRTR
jgi:acetoin utilization deacetylase AcuC-like enzyme